MFTNLKMELHKEESHELLASRLYEGVSDTVKDKFLSDPDFVTLGAESDPEIEKLVNSIPEYGPDPEKELKQLEEAFIANLD